MSLHTYMQKSVAIMQPAIPDEVAHEEMENYEMVPNQVQIIKMVDKGGKEIKRVCPILRAIPIHQVPKLREQLPNQFWTPFQMLSKEWYSMWTIQT